MLFHDGLIFQLQVQDDETMKAWNDVQEGRMKRAQVKVEAEAQERRRRDEEYDRVKRGEVLTLAVRKTEKMT